MREEHQKTHGRPPSDQELQSRLELSVGKFLQLAVAQRPAATVSYAAKSELDPDEDACAIESLPDGRRTTPLSDAEHEDLKRMITRGFCQRDHLIIVLYYYEHLTMREVGQPIILTSVIVVGGFLVFALGAFVPLLHFGLLSSAAIVLALLSDLILLPALLSIFRPSSGR